MHKTYWAEPLPPSPALPLYSRLNAPLVNKYIMYTSKFTGSIDNFIIRGRRKKLFARFPAHDHSLLISDLLLLCWLSVSRIVASQLVGASAFSLLSSPSCYSQPWTWTWTTLPPTMEEWWSWWHPSSISWAVTTSSSKPGSPPPEVQLLGPVSVSSSLLSLTDGWMQFLLWLNYTWGEGFFGFQSNSFFCLAHAEACRTLQNMPIEFSGSTSSCQSSDTTEDPPPVKKSNLMPKRSFPPFMTTVDVPLGILYAFQRLLGFGLMLSVM